MKAGVDLSPFNLTLCTRKKLLPEEIDYHDLGAHESFGCRDYSMLARDVC